jgi:xanthine dehydrogenase accessory factor
LPDVERELVERRAAGEPVVLATVVRLGGQPPSRAGAKALLGSEAILAGTLGCSEFDQQALGDARRILESGAPELVTYGHDLGTIEVYLEPHLRRPQLVVFGDTPVGRALARWAPEVGFEVLTPSGSQTLEAFPSGELYAVHTNHDAPDLVDALLPVLAAGPRYVGVMGSRRHTAHHLDELRRRGADPSLIESPVGLDIGARTAEEIALAILAGLVAVRRGAAGGRLSRPGSDRSG